MLYCTVLYCAVLCCAVSAFIKLYLLIIDILLFSPTSISTLGKYTAIKEIEFCVQNNLKYYYMGFYIHSCKKMRYKGEYKPSELLCPTTLHWHDLEGCLKHLNKYDFCPFDSNLAQKRYLIAENEKILHDSNVAQEDIEKDDEARKSNDVPDKEGSSLNLEDSQAKNSGIIHKKSKTDNDKDNNDGDGDQLNGNTFKEIESSELEAKRLENIKLSPLAIFAPQFDFIQDDSHPPSSSTSSSSLTSSVLPFSSTSIASGVFSMSQRNSPGLGPNQNSDNNMNITNNNSNSNNSSSNSNHGDGSDMSQLRSRSPVKVSHKHLCSIPLDLGVGIVGIGE